MTDEKRGRPDLSKPARPDAADDATTAAPAVDDAPTAAPTVDDAPTATSASDATRPRAAAPGAAAARRARQLGGPRRPLPQPRTTTDGAAIAPTDAAAASAPTAGTTTGGTSPKSSVGKAAARPRPRPRPTASTTAGASKAAAAKPSDPDATATATDDATTPARPRRRGRLLVGAGLVLAVLLFAVGALFLVLTLTATAQVDQRETDRAVAAAKSDVALVTSFGYQTIDSDAAKAAAVLTGTFKQQYLDSITKVVKPQLPTTQTVTTGQVDSAGLVSADARGRQVVVLVYGQQSVTNKAQTTPRIDAFQIRVTMQRVDGEWLVAQLDQLGNNA